MPVSARGRAPRLYNLGSINLDHIFHVPAPPSAGRTLLARSHAVELGGKGLNQSVAAARAGAAVAHLGAVGDDGAAALTFLEAQGVSTEWIQKVPARSGQAIIQVDPTGENSILVDPGANAEVTPGRVRAALATAEPGDWFLAQNETSAVPEALAAAAERGLRVAVNPAPVTPDVLSWPFEQVHLVVVNEHECADLSGEREAERGADRLARRWPAAMVMVTLGAEGCLYRHPAGGGSVPARRVEAVDTTAAGDTFCGYLVASLLVGHGLLPALRRATAAAALAVTRVGAAASIPTAEEVAGWL